jgi:hypothetical protein
VRAELVVVGQPVVGSALDLADRVEEPGVQNLLAEAAVEAFDEGVLVRRKRAMNCVLDRGAVA